MTYHKRILVTVVTEAALESSIARDLEAFPVHGYTVTDARGRGHHGMRSGDWQEDGNIHIDIVCTDEAAEAVAEHLRNTYFDHYAMIVYLSDVRVLRAERF